VKNRGVILAVLFIIGVFLILLSQKGKLPQMSRAVEGLEAPGFTFLDKDSKSFTLSQYIGKIIFIHFWASWCKECKDELPGIQALYDRKKSDPNFVFFSVIWREDPATSRKYLEDNNFDFPIYIDPGEKTAREYGVTGLPETYIIAEDGVLKKKIIGPGRWDEI
jgi:peroxiredoxin